VYNILLGKQAILTLIINQIIMGHRVFR